MSYRCKRMSKARSPTRKWPLKWPDSPVAPSPENDSMDLPPFPSEAERLAGLTEILPALTETLPALTEQMAAPTEISAVPTERLAALTAMSAGGYAEVKAAREGSKALTETRFYWWFSAYCPFPDSSQNPLQLMMMAFKFASHCTGPCPSALYARWRTKATRAWPSVSGVNTS